MIGVKLTIRVRGKYFIAQFSRQKKSVIQKSTQEKKMPMQQISLGQFPCPPTPGSNQEHTKSCNHISMRFFELLPLKEAFSILYSYAVTE